MPNEAQITLSAKDRATGVINKLTGTMDRMARKADVLARKAQRILAIGGAIGVAGIKSMMDFEMQMAMVGTMLTNGAEKWLPEFTEGIEKLSMEFGETTKTLSKGLYDILSASIPAEEAMKVLRIATESAKGGFTTTAVAVDGITSLLNAYGLEAKYASEVSDLMFTTVRLGKTTFSELAANIGKVAPMAKVAGMSMDNMLASLSTMTRQGLNTAEATTRLSALLRTVPESGAALHELIESFRGKDLAAILKIIPESRAAQAIAALGQDFEGFARDMNEMLVSSGARIEAFGKVQETFGFRWGQIKMIVLATARAIGAALIPMVEGLLAVVGRFVTIAREWIKANTQLFQTIIKWTLGILVAMIVLPKIIGMISILTKALIFLATTPFGLVLFALAALATAFALTAGEGDNFKTRMLDGFKKLIIALDVMLGSWEGFKNGIAMIGSQITSIFKKGWIHLKIWFSNIVFDMMDSMNVIWKVGWEKIKHGATWVWKWLKVGWSDFATGMKIVWANMAAGFGKAWSWIKKAVGKTTKEEYEKERAEIDKKFNESINAAANKNSQDRLDAEREYVEGVKAMEDQLQEDLMDIYQQNADTHAAMELLKQEELEETERVRQEKLETYMASLAELPKLSEKMGDLWAKLAAGLSFDSAVDEINKMANDISNAGVEVPDWITGMVAGNMQASATASDSGGGKPRFEAASAMFRRIQEAAAAKTTPEVQIAEKAFEVQEEQLTEAQREVKATEDLLDSVEELALAILAQEGPRYTTASYGP